MQEFVKVNEELADRSALYLAMWKALEAFDPKVDRWSEPVSFGSQKERAKAAEGAISRFSQRHPNAPRDGSALPRNVESVGGVRSQSRSLVRAGVIRKSKRARQGG